MTDLPLRTPEQQKAYEDSFLGWPSIEEYEALRRSHDEAAGLLKWVADELEKKDIALDNWYGEYELWRDHSLNPINAKALKDSMS